MSAALSFQDMILRLTEFWKKQGCLVQQPYYVQVGAGTMNPATALHTLGPEPWNVVYVEPSIRPDDGRFGDNPNRMQMHHQLQVILKPEPGNPQELYLQSLAEIGVNLREHDVRFVEDNWESPALGAWGLGWEVWLDGQEITQFTYFQQSGSVDLDPVCAEITYGLDRIALALQGKDSVWQIELDGSHVLYGDVFLQREIEHSEYYFNLADVDALMKVYDTYENEAQRCINAGFVLPAHDYVLKCSHLFNVMDTRGAIGVTERAVYFKRMRKLAAQIAALYIKQREEKSFPALQKNAWGLTGALQRKPAETPAKTVLPDSADFLLEIGCEELPAQVVTSLIEQLQPLFEKMLTKLRLEYDGVTVSGTPRRIGVQAHRLSAKQPDIELTLKGPAAAQAFDSDGKPTETARKFAQSKGLAVEDLRVTETEGKRFVSAQVMQPGKFTVDLLAEEIPQLLNQIHFEKSMRWSGSNGSFSRPVRWITALLGGTVVPFTFLGAQSGNVSYGLRPYGSPTFTIESAARYAAQLREHSIILNRNERKEMILQQAQALAEPLRGVCAPNPDTLEEVVNLVEFPTAFLGRFEDRFLNLPAEILVAVMQKHQRYFPVYTPEGSIMPYYIGVRNGDTEGLDVVAAGNDHVIRARFSDAEFFYQQDIKHPIAYFVDQLETLQFQKALGSMKDKTSRMEKLGAFIAKQLKLPRADAKTAQRAILLAKADLMTKMVIEITSLQGIMGGHYAKLSGEPEQVCQAVAEQYKAVSHTNPGLVLAVTDRIDTLTGLAAANLLPKGSNDPYACRRSAIQLVENLIENSVSLDLRPICEAALKLQPISGGPDTVDATLTFIAGRLEFWLRDKGIKTSVVKAALSEQSTNPSLAFQVASALSSALSQDDWKDLLDAYARCARIVRSQPDAGQPVDAQLLIEPQEKALFAVFQKLAAGGKDPFATLLGNLRLLQPVITDFFDHVLVMDEDIARRNNRLALLRGIARLTSGVADFSELEGF